MTKKTNRPIKAKNNSFFSLFYAIFIISTLVLSYTWGLPFPKGFGITLLSIAGIFIFGLLMIIFAIRIILAAKKTENNKIHAYSILGRYAIIAPIISAIILYVANNIANKHPFYNYLDRNFLNTFSFVSFALINIIGIIHAVIYAKHKKSHPTKQ